MGGEADMRGEVDDSVDESVAVRALARRCEERLDVMVEHVTASWAAQLPGYQAMRDAEQHTALHRTIGSLLRLMQGAPADEDLRLLFRKRAAYRAEQGVPLATLLRTYTIATQALFEAVRREARHDEMAALAQIARILFGILDEAVAEVASAYQEELAALGAVRRDRRRELVRDLVTGGAVPDAAVLEEFGLDAGAAVLAIRLGPLGAADSIPPQPTAAEPAEAETTEPASPEPPVHAEYQRLYAAESPNSTPDVPERAFSAFEVAARRRMLRLQRALDGHFGRPIPALLEQSGGHALVPGANSPVSDELSQQLSDLWGDEARIAVAVADRPERIGPAAATATEVLRLVSALGRPPGVYALDDVLLEYHLTRQDESAQLLDALLDPLSGRADLLHTVRVFLDEEYDRRRTASRLGLHPNTVDNRLARVTELTGLDPATPRGVALLMTALTLRDLRAQ